MRFAIRSLSARLARFATNAAGNIALFFGLGAPLLFGFVGVAVDYSTWSRQTTVLQKAADGAALAAANELRVAEPDSRRIQAVAESVVRGQVKLGLGDEPVTVKAELVKTHEGNANQTDKDAEAVKVTLWQRKAAVMSRLVTPELTDIEVSATAKLVGGTKICVIGLDDNAPGTVRLEDSARISAGGCSVYVNSTSPSAVRSEEDARIVSLLTCTAGGYKGGSANFAPKAPTTDCPRTKDPLAGRPTPSVGACKYNNRVLEAGLHLLQPGTYCGGLTLKPGAIAMLSPGIYVVKDGPLHVGPPVLSIGLGPIGLGVLPATLKGTNVGFYFTGMVKPDDSGAVVPMRFMKESVVEMTAPKTGRDGRAPLPRGHERRARSPLRDRQRQRPPARRHDLSAARRLQREREPAGRGQIGIHRDHHEAHGTVQGSEPRAQQSLRRHGRARSRGHRAEQRRNPADALGGIRDIARGMPPGHGSDAAGGTSRGASAVPFGLSAMSP
jgi:Putative Flp pilus-assembly TadE/G-like